jgi:hypothetical protein
LTYVDVEIGRLRQRPLDCVIACVIRILAVGILARDGGALLKCGQTVAVVCAEVALILRLVDDRIPAVVIAEVDVGQLLDGRIVPAVVDAERNNGDRESRQCARGDGSVLGLEIVREFRTVVAAVLGGG